MNRTIAQFIQQQKVATICANQPNLAPYCFNCMYVFHLQDAVIYYKSSGDAYHSSFMTENAVVAGTILPDKINFLGLQGIQFEGELIPKHSSLYLHATSRYYAKMPMALAMPGDIWAIQLNHLKMTDNTKLFGKKLQWNREVAVLTV